MCLGLGLGLQRARLHVVDKVLAPFFDFLLLFLGFGKTKWEDDICFFLVMK
jgi:hypothetical protein